MSTCSATHSPQPCAALPYTTQNLPPVHARFTPMACDGAVAPPTPGALAAGAAAGAAELGDAVNGQHHLLRHVLSPEQCSDALQHFGTTDSKAAARMVNRMSQRELRDMFAKVYTVHTNSNNNTWLRRKLLEAVGASRRFYAAANRTGRAKPRRTAAHSGRTPARSPKATAAAAAPAHAPAGEPMHVTSTAALHSGAGHQAAAHHALPPGPALPAGSPRALTQRLRRAAAGGGSVSSLDTHAPFHHRYLHQTGSFGAAAAAQTHSSNGGATSSEGSHGHPAALAPHPSFDGDCSGGCSAFAAAARQQQIQQQQYQQYQYQQRQQCQLPVIPFSGSNSSLQSAQFAAAPAPLSHAGMAPTLPGVPVGTFSGAKLPPASPFCQLALLPAAPAVHAADPASQLAPLPAATAVQAADPTSLLQPGPSSDLVSLWGLTSDPCLSHAKSDREDVLTWGDWELPSLF